MKIQSKDLEYIKNNYDLKKYEKLIEEIGLWLQKKVKKAKATGLVLGISGGIDSATLAFIAYKFFKSNLHLYTISINDDLQFIENVDAKMVFDKLNMTYKQIDLSKALSEYKKALNIDKAFILANLKARMRMNFLYAKAQEKNSLVLGTDNLNEFYLGYFTKFGDGACDLLPFANIKKSDVYIMAKILGVPKQIITKNPSADLWENQTDEDELGFSYDDFELYLQNKNNISADIKHKIEMQHKKNIHKQIQIPKGPKF